MYKNIKSLRMRQGYPVISVFACAVLFLSPAQVQAQQQYHRQRGHPSKPIFSFQSFDHTPAGFSGTDISSDLASQLRSISSSAGAPEYQEQPPRGGGTGAVSATANGNELGGSHALPLYKQSYPGLYVKGHAPENFKYEATHQVDHHHGPNYPRAIGSSSHGRGGGGGSGNGAEFQHNPFPF